MTLFSDPNQTNFNYIRCSFFSFRKSNLRNLIHAEQSYKFFFSYSSSKNYLVSINRYCKRKQTRRTWITADKSTSSKLLKETFSLGYLCLTQSLLQKQILWVFESKRTSLQIMHKSGNNLQTAPPKTCTLTEDLQKWIAWSFLFSICEKR